MPSAKVRLTVILEGSGTSCGTGWLVVMASFAKVMVEAIWALACFTHLTYRLSHLVAAAFRSPNTLYSNLEVVTTLSRASRQGLEEVYRVTFLPVISGWFLRSHIAIRFRLYIAAWDPST